MTTMPRAIVLLSAMLVGGCVSTAVAIVTAPVKIVGAGIDAVYTSQAERDEKRGRAIRKQEEADRKAARKAAKEAAKDAAKDAARDAR